MGANLTKLAGQTATYGLSTVLARLLNFLLTPYLTRIFADNQSVFGEINLMYTYIPFALVLLTMGLESGYFRFAGKAQNQSGKDEVFATTWGAVSLVSAIFMVAVLLLQHPIATALRFQEYHIWMMGLIITIDAVSALPFARLRERGRAGQYVLVRLISVILNIVLCVFFFSVLPRLASSGILTEIYSDDFGAGYVLVANLVTSAVTLLILLSTCYKITPRIKPKVLKTIMIYSAPLLVSGIAGTANELIDRGLLDALIPGGDINYQRSVVGVYGAVARLAVIMTLFVQMYRLAAEPFFLNDFKKDDFKKANAETMKYYFIVTIFIFLFITLFSDLIILILGRGFRGGVYLLPIILLANMLSGVILNLSFWYKQMEATKYAIIITGTGLVVIVGLCYLLIPRYEALGAATARLASEIVMVVVSYYINQKYFPIPYNLRRIGLYLLVGGGLYGVGVLCSGFSQWIRYPINLVLCLAFIAFAVRKEKIDVPALIKSILKSR